LAWLADVLKCVFFGRVKPQELSRFLSGTWESERLAVVLHA
jgi:hypothetical protein